LILFELREEAGRDREEGSWEREVKESKGVKLKWVSCLLVTRVQKEKAGHRNFPPITGSILGKNTAGEAVLL